MAAILADDISKRPYLNEILRILIEISLKVVPKGPIDNNPVLVEIMTWRRIGDKPLSEPMLTRFTDAYMLHYGRWVNFYHHLSSYTFLIFIFLLIHIVLIELLSINKMLLKMRW